MFRRFFKNPQLGILFDIFVGVVIYVILLITLVRVESISDQSALTTYSNAFWYSIVTLTTVGYGDLFPATVYGRFIGAVFVLLSLSVHIVLIGTFVNLMSTIKENRKLGLAGINFTDHAIVIGWDDFGKMVVEQLMGVGKKIVIVTDNKLELEHIYETYDTKNIFVFYNDLKNFEALEKVNITHSSIVFVNLPDDTDKLVWIVNIRKVYPDLEFVVTLENGDLKNTFISAGVTNTISKHEISSKLLASYMFEPDVASYSESIMSFAQSDGDYDIKQFLVTPSNPYVGKTYQETFFELKKKYNSVLIGITKRDKYGNKRLIKNPLGDLKIGMGDYLIVILNGKAFKLLKKVFNVEEGVFKNKKKS
ncbi:MAG: NAD-binding protein [Cytophagales bacterium]|nr:NAD-binding protein [Cytophagales bacterium]